MGYRADDLHDLIKPVFEIDSYQSKMGEDDAICVVSFTVNEHQAAKDLVDFLEKGYDFILDADSTPGEVEDGNYKVFVEIERDKHLSDNIVELLDGVGKIGAINPDDFRFRYYKSFRSKKADAYTLSEMIPFNSESYYRAISEGRMENYKNFFDKSFLENVEMFDDNLKIKRAFADPVFFAVKDFGKTEQINETLEKINVNDYAEILFLTKYIGDYNVTKFGKKTLTFENKGYTLVVERL